MFESFILAQCGFESYLDRIGSHKSIVVRKQIIGIVLVVTTFTSACLSAELFVLLLTVQELRTIKTDLTLRKSVICVR